ncbi:MAG: lycopene cyclase family protein, partial [Pseudomonadota bacterium]
LLLGAAWQAGLVPLSHAALVRAITLNGAGVEGNLRAFELGRWAVAAPKAAAAALLPQDQGAHFMYVLPYSRGTTLLESTFLTPPGHESVDYESYALEYAERHFGIRSPRIVDRESGALPMTLGPLGAGATRRVWPIGTRAGVGRASSGYAFDAIQRDSAQVIAALGRNTSRPRPPRSPLLSLLDRVLISWLSEDQSAAPRVFGDLFAKSPPKSLIRFLADVPTLFDLWSTMWSMPKLETSLHAVTHPRAWPRLS